MGLLRHSRPQDGAVADHRLPASKQYGTQRARHAWPRTRESGGSPYDRHHARQTMSCFPRFSDQFTALNKANVMIYPVDVSRAAHGSHVGRFPPADALRPSGIQEPGTPRSFKSIPDSPRPTAME